jgi:LytS/YehU family sensor histidine kinase
MKTGVGPRAAVKEWLGGRRSVSAQLQLVAAALWLCSYVVATARAHTMDESVQIDLRRAILHVIAFGLTLLGYRALELLNGRTLALRMAAGICLAELGAAVYGGMNQIAMYLILPVAKLGTPWETVLQIMMAGTMVFWIFLLCAACHLALTYREALQRQALELAQVQALALDAQNRMLRYQLNPHFLFNTLNALSTLVLERDNDRAEQVLQSLSRFLRRSLHTDPAAKLTLAEEMAAAAEYLSIEQVRFGQRLSFTDKTSPQAQAALAPSLILQPLLENAVKHGVARSTETVAIVVSADVIGERLRLVVEDDAAGPKAAAGGSGIGLANVRSRLELLYDGCASIAWGPRPGGGFRVAIELPAERP